MSPQLFLPERPIDLGRGFDVIVADPGWQFGDSLPGPKRGASKHYSTMLPEQIEAFLHVTLRLPVAPDAWLFLWRVASMQEEALNVASSWGFIVKSEIVWIKSQGGMRPQIGMGHYVRNAHEVCLVCVRGKPKRASASVPSWFVAPRTRHSAKPDVFFEIIDRLVGPEAQKIELFARKRREGYASIGDELQEVAT